MCWPHQKSISRSRQALRDTCAKTGNESALPVALTAKAKETS